MAPPGATTAVLVLLLLGIPGCSGRRPAAAPDDDVRTSAAPPLTLRVDHALALEAAPRSDGRVGAIQLEVRLRNGGAQPVAVVADPWLARLRVAGEEGPVRCSAPTARMTPPPAVEIAPGEALPLRVDVAARCEVTAPGAYDVDVSFDGPGGTAMQPVRVRVTVAPRTWVNPGPR